MVSIRPVVRHAIRGATVGSTCPHDHLPVSGDQTGDAAPLRHRTRPLPRDPTRRGDRVRAAGVGCGQGRRQDPLRAAGALSAAARNGPTAQELRHLAPRAGAIPEVAGEAALLSAPEDAQALADNLLRLLTDQPLRERQVAAGRARAALYSWSASAAAHREVYESVVAV